MSGPRSMRSVIRELHEHDPKMSVKEIARRANCEPDYVYTCLSQLGLKVGHPWTDKEVKTRNRHNVVEAYASQPVLNDYCRFVWLSGGQLHRCGVATGGHTYCPSCERHRASLHAGSKFASIRSVGKYGHFA